MKSTGWNSARLLSASAFALLCFGVGYLSPHHSIAFAQTPRPSSSMDDVPGGGGGHGGGFVTNATTTQLGMLTAKKSGWTCAKGNHCLVSFTFRVSPHGSATPKPFTCPQGSVSCLTFTGTNYDYHTEDPYTGNPVETVHNVQIAGMFQLGVAK